ncbi:SENP1 protease, partial [Daphoenositta chrysoptera]|nr:SENP1 protease [Daphoenositta chrysoptera]
SSGNSGTFGGKSALHGASFPLKPAPSPSWSRRSPKKAPRRFLSAAEETVREEEREIYRQLLQMVTGKRFSSCKPSPLLPFQLSRCPRSGPSLSQEALGDDPEVLEIPKIPGPIPHPPEPPRNSQNSPLGPSLGYPGGFQPQNSAAQQQREEQAASGAQSEGSDSVILLKVKDSGTPAPSLPYFHAELWIKELTSVYDSRARERWRQIEEQKALALRLQSQVRIPWKNPLDWENRGENRLKLTFLRPLFFPVLGRSNREKRKYPELEIMGNFGTGREFFLASWQEMEKEIKSLFRGGNQDEVLSEAFRLTITRKDIQTLNNLNWLNDEV